MRKHRLVRRLLLPAAIIATLILTCTDKRQEARQAVEATGAVRAEVDCSGSYASEGYSRRNEGYDWIGVIVDQIDDSKISVSVRSRADIKKPTCYFEAEAQRVGDGVYRAVVDGKGVLFAFENSGVSIGVEDPSDESILYYYCSGGASLAGTYEKIPGSLDEHQIDRTVFSKVLTLQNIGFDVSAKQEGGKQMLTIIPFGLVVDNSQVTHNLEGEITGAEIEDLNSDGFPELLIYTRSGLEQFGDVIGYSVNAGQSMSAIYFPSVSENPDINSGYGGHDQFAVVETSLAHRFPVFSNGRNTGRMRQVQYALVDGEASRRFVVKHVTEFDSE